MKTDPGPFAFNTKTSAMFLKRNSPCVYFIQEELGGAIKIGRSNADGLDNRMSGIQCGNPRKLNLVALVCMGGSRSVGVREEGRLHRHFANFRIRGEWYESCASLNALMSEYSMETYGGQLRDILRGALMGSLIA